MPGIGVGVAVGLMGSAQPPTVSISSLPDILLSGELATISGTSNAEGQTVTLTIGGETFGTDTVSGGAWSIAASPTDAMKGNAVAVVATVAGVSASSTTHVLPSGIVAGFDARLGVDTRVSGPDTFATDITAQFPVGSEPVASQATAASQPAYDGASLDFDGSDDYMTLGAGLGAQTSHHLFFVMSLEVGSCQFLDAQTGRIAFGRSPAGALGWYDGSWRVISGATGTEALSMSVLEYELDGVGGTGIVRINGVTQTLSSSVYAATALGGTIAIGSAFSGGSGWAATIMRVPGYIYPATLSAADAAIVRVALADVHGVTL